MNSTHNPFAVTTTRVSPYSYSASPMSAAVLVVVIAIFFLVLFALFARKFFSSVHSSELQERRRSPPRPHAGWRLSYYSPPVRSFGLDPALLRTVPLRPYRSSEREGCVVCLQAEFEEGEKVKAIAGCGHVFHPECIDGWLVLHGSCPICRCSKVCFDDDRDREEEEVVEVVVVVEEEEEEEEEEELEEERKVVLGRSRSLCWREGEEDRGGRSFLRRAYSV